MISYLSRFCVALHLLAAASLVLLPNLVAGAATLPPVSVPTAQQLSFNPVQATAGNPTPRALITVSPGFVFGSQTITEDTVWRGEVLLEGAVVIAPQATLTIESGTVIRSRRSSADLGDMPVLLIQGRCVAAGTREKPILFTSSYVLPQAGDWQGVVILASEKKNLFEQCRFEGAETGLEALYSNITIKNSSFEKCLTGARFQDCLLVQTGGGARDCGTGISISESEADLRELEITGNGRGMNIVRTSINLIGSTITGTEREALSIEKSRVKIAGNNIISNGSGMKLLECDGTVSTNRLVKNTEYGLSIGQSRIKVNSNEISGNPKVGLRAEDGKGVAWGNAIMANGLYDIYNAGVDDFRAFGNWWGTESAADAGKRIYDRRTDGSKGRVLYLPVLRVKPQIGS